MTQQIVYVAIGPNYLGMALRSATQAQAAGFAGGVVIVTDQPPPSPAPAGITFTAVATPSGPMPFAALGLRDQFLQWTTADEILCLDCDTIIKGDVTPAFVASGIAMASEAWPTPAQGPFVNDPDYPAMQAAGLDTGPWYNCGVIAVANTPAMQALCGKNGAWYQEWARFGGWDELAMLRALKTLGITPTLLDPKFDDMGLPKQPGSVIEHWLCGDKALPGFTAGLGG